MTREELLDDLDIATKAGDVELARAIDAKLSALGAPAMTEAPPKKPSALERAGLAISGKISQAASESPRAAALLPALQFLGRTARAGTAIGEVPLMLASPEGGQQYANFMTNVLGGEPGVPEQVLAAGAGGGITGAASRAIGPVRGVMAGLSSYGGGELGGEVARSAGINPLWGAIPGALAGGVPFAIPRLPGTAPAFAAESLKGKTPAEVQQAIRLQSEAPFLAPSQLFEHGGQPIRDLEARVLGSPTGKGDLELKFADIPKKSEGLASKTFSQFGPVRSDTHRANQIEESIEAALDPSRYAGNVAKPYYDMMRRVAPNLSVQERFSLSKDLAMLNENLNFLERSLSGRAVTGVERAVTSPTKILAAKPGATVGEAARSAGKAEPFRIAEADVDTLKNYLRTDLQARINALSKPEVTSSEKAQLAGLQSALTSIKRRLYEASPELKLADARYGEAREGMTTLLRQTGLPESARNITKGGPLRPAARWEQFQPILERGEAGDVALAAQQLRMQDPQAFRQVAQNWFQREFDKAFVPGKGDFTAPKKFAESLISNKNLDTIVEEAAIGVPGVNPTEVAVGFRKALQILQASGRPTGKTSPADFAAIQAMDPMSLGARVLAGHEISRSGAIVRTIVNSVQQQQMRQLYKALNRPDSMQALAELAHMNVMSPRTASFLSGIVGGTVALEHK